MLWAILLVVIAIGVAIYEKVTSYPGYSESILLGIMTFAVGLIPAMLVTMFCSIVFNGEYKVTHKLQAVQDTSTGSGSFFLGSGAYNEEPAFFYYVDRGEYSTLEHIEADSARIVESSGEPRVTQECTKVNPWIGFSDCSEDKTFYVPKGSIVNNFQLDARD